MQVVRASPGISFFASSTMSSLGRTRILGSSRSCTRMPTPGGLVLVSGPDAAPGRADGEAGPAASRPPRPGHHVVRHDQVGVAPDAQPVQRDAALLERVELQGQERTGGWTDRAVADHAEGVGVEDPRGDQVQLVDLIAGDDRVPGVVAPLVARGPRRCARPAGPPPCPCPRRPTGRPPPPRGQGGLQPRTSSRGPGCRTWRSCPRKVSFTRSVGPWRFLAMLTSATPFSSESSL